MTASIHPATNPTIKLEAAEVCIYCGALVYAPDSKRRLAEEHIIPYGLNGNIVIPRASCRRCERITGRSEQLLLKGSLLGCRSLLGLRTRSPKERPKALPLFDPRTTPNKKVMIPIEDYPVSLLFLMLPAPGLIRSTPPEYRLWHRFLGDDKSKVLASRYGLPQWATSSLDSGAQLRILAKIAHSFAAGTFGINAFDAQLPRFIIGDEKQEPFDYVGGSLDDEPSSQNLHEVSMDLENGRDGLMIVRVRLFASLGAPTYRVIVGSHRLPNALFQRSANT